MGALLQMLRNADLGVWGGGEEAVGGSLGNLMVGIRGELLWPVPPAS